MVIYELRVHSRDVLDGVGKHMGYALVKYEDVLAISMKTVDIMVMKQFFKR